MEETAMHFAHYRNGQANQSTGMSFDLFFLELLNGFSSVLMNRSILLDSCNICGPSIFLLSFILSLDFRHEGRGGNNVCMHFLLALLDHEGLFEIIFVDRLRLLLLS
jgi:hypothetical protein